MPREEKLRDETFTCTGCRAGDKIEDRGELLSSLTLVHCFRFTLPMKSAIETFDGQHMLLSHLTQNHCTAVESGRNMNECVALTMYRLFFDRFCFVKAVDKAFTKLDVGSIKQSIATRVSSDEGDHKLSEI